MANIGFYEIFDNILSFAAIIVAVASIIIAKKKTTQSNEIAKEAQKISASNHRDIIFSDFTKRFQEIILKEPSTLRNGDARSDDENVNSFMTLYVNLCSEEYYLFTKGAIEKDIWEYWVEGMRMQFTSHVYQVWWKKNASKYNQNFNHFINTYILSKLNK